MLGYCHSKAEAKGGAFTKTLPAIVESGSVVTAEEKEGMVCVSTKVIRSLMD